MSRRTYREPGGLGRLDLARSRAERDLVTLREAIIAIALRDPDRAWVEEQVAELMRDPDGSVRSVAALAVGHLARIHGAVDDQLLIPILTDLLNDPDARGNAEVALDDISTYT
jgi:HEAT repeat